MGWLDLFKSKTPDLPDRQAASDIFASPVLAPAAGFMDGTDGAPRMAWARYGSSGLGSYSGGSPYVMTMGGPTARERGQAAGVATDLATSNPAIATIIESLVTNALGTGLTLSSKPDAEALGISVEDAKALSDTIEKKWKAFAANPLAVDWTGRFDLHALAAAAYRSFLVNGEVVATLEWKRAPGSSTSTKVNLLDPRQLDTTKTTHEDASFSLNGVAFDKTGRVAGYWLRNLPLGNTYAAPMPTLIPASTPWGRQRVIHIFDLTDARQVRGLSPLVAALTPAHERESLAEFTMASALLQSTYALTVESDLPANAAFAGLSVSDQMSGGFSGGMGEYAAGKAEWYSRSKITPQPGVVNHLSPGDKLRMNSVQTPNSTFESFDKSLTRKAARAAGTTHEDVSGDWSAVNFSASRMASELPHRLNMRRRKAIVEKFYASVYAAWLEEQIETGQIAVPQSAAQFWAAKEAYTSATFIGLGRAEPDRKKAADATILELENGLTTLGAALAERGIDLDVHVEELQRERGILRAAGLDHPFFPGVVTTQTRDENLRTTQ
jgi:lambda family phage portal protein